MLMRYFIRDWDNLDWFDRFFFRYLAFFIFLHLILLVLFIIYIIKNIPYLAGVIKSIEERYYKYLAARANIFCAFSHGYNYIDNFDWYHYLTHNEDKVSWLYDFDHEVYQIFPNLDPDWDHLIEFAAINAYHCIEYFRVSVMEAFDFFLNIFWDDEG